MTPTPSSLIARLHGRGLSLAEQLGAYPRLRTGTAVVALLLALARRQPRARRTAQGCSSAVPRAQVQSAGRQLPRPAGARGHGRAAGDALEGAAERRKRPVPHAV